PDVEATRGVGIAIFGGEATLVDLEIGGLLTGPSLPGVAIAVSPSAGVPADAIVLGTTIDGGAGYGVFVDGSDAMLDAVHVSNLGLAAVRVQNGSLVGH